MFIGANPQDLDRLAADFDAAADVLDRGHSDIAAALARTTWNGPDAADMRQQWNGYAKTRMAAAAGGLREGAKTLRRNAEEQRRTSAADVGGLSSSFYGGVGGPPAGSMAKGVSGDLADRYFQYGELLSLINQIATLPENTDALFQLVNGSWVPDSTIGGISPLWGLGVVASAAEFSDAWSGDDSTEKWKKGLGGVVAVASFHPKVAMAKLIWDVDYFIADQTVNALDRAGVLGGTQGFNDYLYKNLYGTDDPTLAQLEHFGGRHQGVWGGFTYASDLVDYNRDRAFDWTGDRVKSVGRYFTGMF